MMLDRLDSVLAAFELTDGSFDLWELAATRFRAAMRETRSKGPSTWRVGIVSKAAFLNGRANRKVD